jgi:hypothetical protein
MPNLNIRKSSFVTSQKLIWLSNGLIIAKGVGEIYLFTKAGNIGVERWR